jgi:hypothetical protein
MSNYIFLKIITIKGTLKKKIKRQNICLPRLTGSKENR